MFVKPDRERSETDASLKTEREKADALLTKHLEELEAVADAVLLKARERADALLAATRAKTDRQQNPNEPPPAELVKERAEADKAVQAERDIADELVREERAGGAKFNWVERRRTDGRLKDERSRSDEAVSTRDELVSLVGHDLRALLSQLMGFANRIALEVSQKADPTEVRKDTERIRRNGARMNRLIGDLIDLSAIHSRTLAVSFQPEHPAAIVKEAVEGFQAQALTRGIEVTQEIALPPTLVELDPARILQVLTSLLSNAIKFSVNNGKVVVKVERLDAEVCFSVTDSGVGIPPARLENIFERYLHTSIGGRETIGLGLYISKGIVLGHGGRIWAQSKPGAGSTFFFTVPLSRHT